MHEPFSRSWKDYPGQQTPERPFLSIRNGRVGQPPCRFTRQPPAQFAALPLAAAAIILLVRALPIEIAFEPNDLGIVSATTEASYPKQKETFWYLFSCASAALMALGFTALFRGRRWSGLSDSGSKSANLPSAVREETRQIRRRPVIKMLRGVVRPPPPQDPSKERRSIGEHGDGDSTRREAIPNCFQESFGLRDVLQDVNHRHHVELHPWKSVRPESAGLDTLAELLPRDPDRLGVQIQPVRLETFLSGNPKEKTQRAADIQQAACALVSADFLEEGAVGGLLHLPNLRERLRSLHSPPVQIFTAVECPRRGRFGERLEPFKGAARGSDDGERVLFESNDRPITANDAVRLRHDPAAFCPAFCFSGSIRSQMITFFRWSGVRSNRLSGSGHAP